MAPRSCGPFRFRRLSAFAFLGLLLVGAPAAAGPGRWTPFGPAGGDASAVVVDPGDASSIWIVSAGSVHQSADGGVSWRSSSRGLPGRVESLVGDPGRPASLYAFTRSRLGHPSVYRSDDGGGRWERMATGGADFRTLQTFVAGPGETLDGRGVLWAGTGDAIWRSRDGAVTWQKVLSQPGGFFISVAPDPVHPRTAYVATSFLRLKTTDGGETWQPLGEVPGGQRPAVHVLAVAPSDPQTLYQSGLGSLPNSPNTYRSRDGGATWQGPFPFAGDRLAVDGADPNVVYGGTSLHGVFVSRDGAETWSRATAGLPDLEPDFPFSRGVQGFAAHPERFGFALVATAKGLFLTEDAGATWRAPAERGLHTDPATLFLVDPFDPKRWVVETFGDLRVTSDRGESFVPFAATLPGRRSTVAFDPFVRGRVWAISSLDAEPVLYRSADLGATWSRVPGAMPLASTLFFPAPRVILAAGSGIHRSTNLGRTWQRVEDGVLDPEDPETLTAAFGRLVRDPRRPEVLFALGGTFGLRPPVILIGPPVIYRSPDSGRTWGIWAGADAIAFDPFHSLATFVADGNRLRVTRNDGVSFQGLPDLVNSDGTPLPFIELVADREKPGQLWAATPHGVRRSRDGAQHWEDASAGLPAGGDARIDLLLEDPTRAGRFVAAPASGGLWRADFPE